MRDYWVVLGKVLVQDYLILDTFFMKNTLVPLAFAILFSCENAPTKQPGIPYSEALKRCEPVKKADIITFDGDCVNGAALPVFSATDMHGKAWTQDSFKGKFWLLNFWFVECKPCLDEMPDLIGLSEKWPNGSFEIVGICRNDRARVEQFLTKTPLPYPILPDCEQIADDVFQNPFGYPASYLIDENGVIVDVFDALKAGNADYQKLVRTIEN